MKSYIYNEINRKELKANQYVEILINDTELKRGKIKRIISKTAPKDGLIRVELTSGEQGKCVKIISNEEFELENFKFFNIFFSNKKFYSIYNIVDKQYLIYKRKYKENTYFNNMMIFSSYEVAERFLKSSKFSYEIHRVVKLHPNKKLSEIINEVNAQLFIIDMKKVVTKTKLIEYERKFK